MSSKAKSLECVRENRWYFGGIAAALATCCTHPLDLIKVHMQTQQEGKITIIGQAMQILKNDSLRGLYSGISAALLRQAVYSTTRFGIYEIGREQLTKYMGTHDLPFYQKIFLAGLGGATAGFLATPCDMVNVRMQNDVKLLPESRRNYKHALDGLFRVLKEEGFRRCFAGATTATPRAAIVTIGQISFYEQAKEMLIKKAGFADNEATYFIASVFAGAVATVLTQPLDVLKTRQMNAKPGEFKNFFALVTYTAKLGPVGFFKGIVPAFLRLAPQTILTFAFLEQLKHRYGVLPKGCGQ